MLWHQVSRLLSVEAVGGSAELWSSDYSVSKSILRHRTIRDSCGRKPASEMPTAKTYIAVHQILPLLQLRLVLT